MRITGYSLFKVPLDPEYKNVFDGYETDLQYLTYLLSAYPHLDKTLVAEGQTRSIKMDGLSTTITVEGAQEDLKDYNYICISDIVANKYTFFFVTNCESRYDARGSASTAQPTTTLTLKFDAFANNISKLNSVAYNDNNHIERRHYEDCTIVDGIVKTSGYITDEEPVFLEDDGSLAEQKKVIWYKVAINPDGLKFRVPPTYQEITAIGSGCHPSDPSLFFVYIPAFLSYVDGNTCTFVKKDCYFLDHTGNKIIKKSLLDVNKKIYNGCVFKSENIASVQLTYYSPYTYTVVEQDDRFNIYIHGANIEPGNVTVGIPQVSGDPIIYYGEYTGQANDNVHCLFKINHQINNIAEDIDVSEKITNINKDLSSLTILSNIKYEARMLKYPYKYNKLCVNGENLALIPKTGSTVYKLDINPEYQVPLYKLYLDDERSRKWLPLKTNGQIITSVDSKEYYLRNNGSSLLAGAISTIVGGAIGSFNRFAATEFSRPGQMIAGAIKNGVEYATSAAKTGVETFAKIKDADNQMDTVNAPSVEAFSDLNQDLITRSKLNITDANIRDKVYYSLHYYGTHIDKIESLRINYHVTYDYVQTSNCALPFITNGNERNELQGAYNRGITRWHIGNSANRAIGSAFYNLNKNLVNLSNVIYNS